MRKKISIIFIFFLLLGIIPFYPKKIYSVECNQTNAANCAANNNCSQIEAACIQQQEKDNNQIYDAQAQLRLINTNYDLAVTQLGQTEEKVQSTEKEINLLNSRIDGLDISLDYLSKLLINKIVQSYKQREISLFSMLFDSESADDLLTKIKYAKISRDNNQKLLIQVQEAKSNFEEQKKLRDEKKAELDNLKALLAKQQIDLEVQKRKKDADLALYQNNLAETQRNLNIAKQQIAGFKSFASTAGVGTISASQFGSGSDGSYYSQRDERWANNIIGHSSENILNVGCLLTSVAMIAKHNGDNSTPADIAADSSRFYGSTAYMSLPWKGVAGRSYHGGVNADQELQNGNYVIVGVGACGYGGSHFVVLTKKDGDDYIMHDPIYGPDLKLSSHYSKSFCSTATFK